MPKISVIVPVYKVEAYIHRCIDSIINQTYRDLEIILVDDGSPDNCGKICDEYAVTDKRVRVIHKKNGGVSSARNTGIDIATGEYLSFVDSDDFVDTHLYERLLLTAEQEHADLVECGHQWGKYPNDDSGKVFSYNNIAAIEKAFRDTRFGSGLSISACAKLFKRSIFEHIRFLENSSYGEDMEATVRAFYHSSKVVKLDVTMYTYMQNDGSCMNSIYTPQKAIGEVLANKSLIHFFEEKKEEQLRHYFVSRTLNIMFSHLYKCYENKSSLEFRDAINFIRKELKQLYFNEKKHLNVKEQLMYMACRHTPRLWYLMVKMKRIRM